MKARHLIHKDLSDCTHVFRRIDAVKPPLTSPYTGPHRVLRRLDTKRIVIEVNGEPRTVSMEVVKLAYIARDESSAQPLQLAEATPHPPVTFQVLDQQPTPSTSCLPHSSATRGGGGGGGGGWLWHLRARRPKASALPYRRTIDRCTDASSVSSRGRSTDDRRRVSQPRHNRAETRAETHSCSARTAHHRHSSGNRYSLRATTFPVFTLTQSLS